jgi:ribosome-associated toxin RatA of RatAB toxin-antitoxin module
MKELSGSAASDVAAPAERCMALLADVERYPEWYPDVVRRVEVLDRDPSGQATKAQTSLHVAYGPVARDFDVTLDVQVQPPDVVRLVRIAHEPTDEEQFEVNWRVRDGGATRTIELRLAAALPVPRFLPVGGIGDGLAQGFVAAAAAAASGAGSG